MRIKPLRQPLRGEIVIPGDKSITHRATILASIAQGDSVIVGPGDGADNHTTVKVMQQLGVDAQFDDKTIHIRGVGRDGLRAPDGPLDCGNSGTTTRLLVGLLAGAELEAELTGDASLSSRPMARVADPLRDLGYHVETTGDKHTLPMRTVGQREIEDEETPVRAILNVASAQVKSCILLSGLYRDTDTEVVEPAVSRDHTERLLRAMGKRVVSTAHYMEPVSYSKTDTLPTAHMYPGGTLRGGTLEVPGDISSAAFLIAAGLIAGDEVVLKNVNINPTRIGLLRVLRRMNAEIRLRHRRVLSTGEPVADMTISKGALCGASVSGEEIPSLIDEVPVLAVIGAMADGVLEIRDAGELRVKESDRVETTAQILEGMGVPVDRLDDGIRVHGQGKTGWSGFEVDAQDDHRIAMAAAIAALGASEESHITGTECIAVSYPAFAQHLRALGADIDDAGDAS